MAQLLNDETRYKILKILESDPRISQRNLAHALDFSLGKANYCLRALIDKGWVKARNFSHSENKRAYAYLLTPSGLEEKARVTVSFLRYKMEEYETLSGEIEKLRREAAAIAKDVEAGDDHPLESPVDSDKKQADQA